MANVSGRNSEYEQMRILKIFSEQEILKIKKTRENFEYKVSQQTRTIKDYVEYIKYERSLMGAAREKIKQQKVTANNTILMQIADRMKTLYTQALSKFTNNIRFWDEYIKFLQTFKYTKDISSTFDRILQYHGDKPEVWLRAILWEYNENFKVDRVKDLLLRAQQRHPESQEIYLTFFRIELENKRQAAEMEALQHAEIVYTNTKKKFTNIEFSIEMLNIANQFSYALSIQETILEDMRTMFPLEEILWHTLAQRELNGQSSVVCSSEFTELIKTEGEGNKEGDSKENFKRLKMEHLAIPPQRTLRQRIQTCLNIYREAVKMLGTRKMWNYYIDAMIELNSDLSTQASLKQYGLRKAFEGAYEANHMSEDHYLQYIALLFDNNRNDENIEKILHKATKIYDTSSRLWVQYMRYYIKHKQFKKVQDVFQTAKNLLGENGTDLWQLYMVYVKSCRNNEAHAEYDRIIMDLSRQPYTSFNTLKAWAIQMVALTENLKRARKAYNLFIKYHPECYEVHDKMAEIQSKLLSRESEEERKCMENMILNFGKTRTDVWIRYMRFERFAGEPKNVSKLHKTALATLNPELLDDFSAFYNLFSNGVV